MKVIATILLLFISILSFGQRLEDTLLTELKSLNQGSRADLRLLAGRYTVSDGMGGFTYQLDSSGTFGRVDFADVGGSHVSLKGTVNLNSNRQIELVYGKGRSTFNVFVFDTFVFLVKPAKISDFQRDFTRAVSSFGRKAVYKLRDETYTAKFMIAFSLASKYSVKGVG
jgi:hypothetical protein